MHYINHNFTDWDFETKHLNRIEKTIYLDLRSDYFCQEKAIDGGCRERLERRLNVHSEEEKRALDFVLKDKFKKKGSSYVAPEWDKIIKDYRYQEVLTAVGDMTVRLKKAGFDVPANAGTPAIREAYAKQFGFDRLTRITNKANANETTNANANGANEKANANANASTNASTNGANETANAPMTNAERQAKSKAERKFIVDRLKEVGEQVTLKTAITTLRNLYNEHFSSDAVADMEAIDAANEKENANANEIANEQTLTANATNESTNANANENNGRKTAITNNHKPLTINQEPITKNQESESAPTQIAVVNNSVGNFEQQQITKPQPTEIAPTTSSQIKKILQQNSASIENWQAPSLEDIRSELFNSEIFMTLDEKLYARYLREFRIYYKANPIAADNDLRKMKLVGWLEIEAKKQASAKANTANNSGRFNIDNEDWSQSGQSPSSNSDLPNGFHPSHSAPTDNKPAAEKVMLNGLWFACLPDMNIKETYDYIKMSTMPGESADEVYKRVLTEMEGAA